MAGRWPRSALEAHPLKSAGNRSAGQSTVAQLSGDWSLANRPLSRAPCPPHRGARPSDLDTNARRERGRARSEPGHCGETGCASPGQGGPGSPALFLQRRLGGQTAVAAPAFYSARPTGREADPLAPGRRTTWAIPLPAPRPRLCSYAATRLVRLRGSSSIAATPASPNFSTTKYPSRFAKIRSTSAKT